MKAAAIVITGGILCAFVILSAQQREYAPSCKMCPGTYVPNSEIQAYVKRAIANQLTDQQIRQVDIGKVNVAVAVVHRGKINNPNANVAEHDLVSRWRIDEIRHRRVRVVNQLRGLLRGAEVAAQIGIRFEEAARHRFGDSRRHLRPCRIVKIDTGPVAVHY